MICPHCKQKIADGSNICPLCFSSLAGYAQEDELQEEGAAAPRRSRQTAYTKGSRGKKRGNSAPTIVAVGIILLLLVLIALIVRSMFSTATPLAVDTPVPKTTLAENFIYFGATATPGVRRTATPNVAVTATPEPDDGGEDAPQEAEANYRTLHKGDQGSEVVMMQQALAALGYLTTASDGIYGTGTQTAVRAFQADHSLDADGIAGKQTLSLLYSLANITPIPSTTPAPGDILDLPG